MARGGWAGPWGRRHAAPGRPPGPAAAPGWRGGRCVLGGGVKGEGIQSYGPPSNPAAHLGLSVAVSSSSNSCQQGCRQVVSRLSAGYQQATPCYGRSMEQVGGAGASHLMTGAGHQKLEELRRNWRNCAETGGTAQKLEELRRNWRTAGTGETSLASLRQI